MPFLRRVPLPMSAVALALAGLGNLLGSYSPAVRAVCGVLSAIVATLVIARVLADRSTVAAELKTAPVLAVMPTLPMALMLLATHLKPFAAGPALVVWAAALVGQLALVALFVSRFVVGFSLERVLPSWFVVFVGFVVGSVTSPAFGMQGVGSVLLFAGLAGYAVTLPIVVARMRAGALPPAARPTVAIFAAPSSLCLVGYLALSSAPNPWVVGVLLGASSLSLLYVLAKLPGVLMAGFGPTHAALTFPMVITATAFKQTQAALGMLPQTIVGALEVVAVAAVVYAVLGFIGLFVRRPAAEMQPATAPSVP